MKRVRSEQASYDEEEEEEGALKMAVSVHCLCWPMQDTNPYSVFSLLCCFSKHNAQACTC
jgi:hypothetical protein